MRLLNIGSGSSGNSTYVGNENTHILVDAGLSRKRVTEGLNEADLGLSDIDAMLITHEHIDHIASLGVLERTKEIPVFATKGTIEGILNTNSLGNFNKDMLVPIEPDKEFEIGDITVKPLKISHDAKEPVCFKIRDRKSNLAIVTDLGRYDDYLINELKDLDLLFLEANHDIRMLEVGPYPYSLKQRILGAKGHLSNEASGKFLNELLHDKIKKIILGHVSKENNTRDLALLAVETEINLSENEFKADDFEILVARQNEKTKIIEA